MTVEADAKKTGRRVDALKGAVLGAAATPLAGLFIGEMHDKVAGELRDLVVFVGILAIPLTSLIGALGGLLIHKIKGPPLPVPIRPTLGMRWTHLAWLVAGGLAGVAAAVLISFPLGFFGGLVGLALAPIWIWSGVAIARRVSRSTFELRPLTGAIICAFAAATVLVSILVATQGNAPSNIVVMAMLGAGALVGTLAYLRLNNEY